MPAIQQIIHIVYFCGPSLDKIHEDLNNLENLNK